MPADLLRRRDALLKRFQTAFDRYHETNAAMWKKYQASANTPTRKEWETVSKALETLKAIQEEIAELDRRIEKANRR